MRWYNTGEVILFRDRTDDFTIKEEQEECVFVENGPKKIAFEEPLNIIILNMPNN